jgi:HD superfamily phosphohydrolase YqeK
MSDALAIYMRWRERARGIVARHPAATFYRREADAVAASQALLERDPLVRVIRDRVATRLEDDFGHGMAHALKVALDAGALMHIEARAVEPPAALEFRIRSAHCAGLLHDLARKQPNHADLGAAQAADLLRAFPVDVVDIEDICSAIRNHEAFRDTAGEDSRSGSLLSDCLYDADKFRWGPDNFTDTLWAMVAFSRLPVDQFLTLYPSAMERLARIKSTFRTPAGRRYGPEFIDLGLAVGEELYRVICREAAAG